MKFWGLVVILLACTGLSAAFGVHRIVAAVLGFSVTFIWAASSLGGTKDIGSFVMVAGFFAVPIAIGTAVAVALGLGLRRLFGGESMKASKELGAPPLAETCEQAIDIAAEHFRRGSRVRIRCPRCERTLVAKRVLSCLIRSQTLSSPVTAAVVHASCRSSKVPPNPSIERTSPGKPGAASHVKR